MSEAEAIAVQMSLRERVVTSVGLAGVTRLIAGLDGMVTMYELREGVYEVAGHRLVSRL